MILSFINKYIKNIDIIYIAIGCAQKNIIIKENHCQQYIEDLNNYNNIIIILIDPELEDNLAICQIYPDLINNNINLLNNRHFSNNRLNILAINDKYDYNIKSIVNIVLFHNKKLIVQDYTGFDLSNIYIKLLKKYGKNILNNILFDITQNNSGCFIDTKTQVVKRNNNFYQPKYEKLNEENKYLNLNNYIDIVLYHISYIIRNIKEDFSYSNKLLLAFIVYDIDFKSKNKNKEYIAFKLAELLSYIVTDIIDVTTKQEFDKIYVLDNLLSENEYNRNKVVNFLSRLKIYS